ncbi:hypothetical protein OXX69_002144 [Metschnikowia pulcherrima]
MNSGNDADSFKIGNDINDSLESTHITEVPSGDIPSESEVSMADYDEIELHVAESQYSAIMHPAKMNQVFRIRAGPGSGKTFTLVARVAQLMTDGILPEEILVLSMANRSVESIRDMLTKLIGTEKAAKVEISTFHSFCAGLLEQYGFIMDTKTQKQNIFDETTWRTMLSFFSGKSVKFGEHTIEGSITPLRLGKAITNIMLGYTTVEATAAEHNINPNYLSRLVLHLKSSGLIRYDELIADATRLMRFSAARIGENDTSRAEYEMPRLANYKAVFVDEFQDVYPALSKIVENIVEYPTSGLAGQCKHLTITGDPHQSIYEFLGTSEQDMFLFHEKVPGMEVVDHQLSESFRCTQPILDAAIDVALKDPYLKLHASRSEAYPQKPVLIQSRSVVEEYQLVADEIVRLLCCSGGLIRMEDIAILTKTNDAAIGIQSVLKSRYGLPSFKLSSGNQWVTSRLHILKHVLSVVAGDSGASVSLMSILLTLDSDFGGRKRVSKLFNESVNKGESSDSLFLENYLFEELSQVSNPKSTLSKSYKKHPAVLNRMAAFLNQVQHERSVLADMHTNDPLTYDPAALVGCLQRMAKLDGIAQFLGLESNETSKSTPLELLESFNDSIHHAYSKYHARPELRSMSFLDYFLQTYDSEVSNPIGNSIKVSTIHSAKGLEFPIVFILGQTVYTASWDKVLQEENASKITEIGNDVSVFGQETNVEVFAEKSLARPKEEIVHENGPVQAPNSTSRLLYVALTRARNLVYVGCRIPYENMSAMTKARFSAASPVLGQSTSQRNAARSKSGKWDSDIVDTAAEGIKAVDEITGKQLIQRKDESVLSASFVPKRDWGSFWDSVSRDVKRPIPSRQKMDLGVKILDDIMHKPSPKIPGRPRSQDYASSPLHYPKTNTKRVGGHAAKLTKSALRSLHYLTCVVRKRAP